MHGMLVLQYNTGAVTGDVELHTLLSTRLDCEAGVTICLMVEWEQSLRGPYI